MPVIKVDSDSVKIIVLAGVSGAGKTTVLNTLEDHGYFCIENLPFILLEKAIRHALRSRQYGRRIAVALDSISFMESGSWCDIYRRVRKLAVNVDTWYLRADLDQLVTRYNETRRRHPYSLCAQSLDEALMSENHALDIYAKTADHLFDTTALSALQLRELVIRQISDGFSTTRQLQIHLFSFGFKYGMPKKADYLFDVRCLPNPYWDSNLRALTGRDEAVKEYLSSQTEVMTMITDISDFMTKWCKRFEQQARTYLDIGIGCTGGQHRSVYIAEEVAMRISRAFPVYSVTHRELTL
ncbi:MAG: RNase adapter RapZ [Francisellaceae bacterium]